MNRRNFLETFLLGVGAVSFSRESLANRFSGIFQSIPSLKYMDIEHSALNWRSIGRELYFGQVDVLKQGKLVDRVSVVKFHPEYNQIRVFNTFRDSQQGGAYTIEEWQRRTNASVLVNSAQYMADPYYYPCALMVCDGKRVGPKQNRTVRGMLVAEPLYDGKKARLLDFSHDPSNFNQYQQGVQHWPIVLDREGKIRVGQSNWQANRTAVAECRDDYMLFLNTEGGFFTLHNLGRFLGEVKELNIKTAMPMDGGYEADMVVRTPGFSYTTYGQFETQGPSRDISVPGLHIKIPSVIGIFPR